MHRFYNALVLLTDVSVSLYTICHGLTPKMYDSGSDSDSRPKLWLWLWSQLQISKSAWLDSDSDSSYQKMLDSGSDSDSKFTKNGVDSMHDSYSGVGIAHLWSAHTGIVWCSILIQFDAFAKLCYRKIGLATFFDNKLSHKTIWTETFGVISSTTPTVQHYKSTVRLLSLEDNFCLHLNSLPSTCWQPSQESTWLFQQQHTCKRTTRKTS